VVEVTGNPPRLVLVSPEERELVEETTDDAVTVEGVAKPLIETEPNLNDLKLISSVFELLAPIMVSNWMTIRSILLSTSATLMALRVMVKPTFRLLRHIDSRLVYPLTQERQ
jgi:hypothetical protein